MDTGLDNRSCIVLGLCSRLDSTDSILAIVLPAIHGSIRRHDEIKDFLCALCVSVVKCFKSFSSRPSRQNNAFYLRKIFNSNSTVGDK